MDPLDTLKKKAENIEDKDNWTPVIMFYWGPKICVGNFRVFKNNCTTRSKKMNYSLLGEDT